MSNYTQTTFFQPKDTLAQGNPNKIIFGAQVDPELAAIAVAIATKYDAALIAAGPIGFGAGSAAAPSIYFGATNNDTGLYSAGAHTLGITASGALVASFASSGITFAQALTVSVGGSSLKGGVTITAPASGSALTVNGVSGAPALTVLQVGVNTSVVNRAGSTANTVGAGPGFEFADTTAGTASELQHAGGQTELWQFNGAWNQLAFWNTNRQLTLNAPAAGTALIVNGLAAQQVLSLVSNSTTNANADFFLSRPSSTANTIAGGPSVQLQDVGNSSASMFQHGHGQTELWQFNSGSWIQLAFWNTSRGLTLKAPASGTSLTVAGVSGSRSLEVDSGAGVGAQQDIILSRAGSTINLWTAGPNIELFDSTNTNGSVWQNSGGQTEFWQQNSGGTWFQTAFWNSNRGLNLNAPASGSGLTVNGVAGGPPALQIQAATTAGQGNGIGINGGTNSSDSALNINNAAGSTLLFRVWGDGGVTVGNPSDPGAGNLAVQGTIAGTAAVSTGPSTVGYSGAPQNAQSANYTLVAADRGKSIPLSGAAFTITIPNSVFSAGDIVILVATVAGTAYTVAAGAGVTLQWANGTNTAGSRTLTGIGTATIYFQTASLAYISGGGLS